MTSNSGIIDVTIMNVTGGRGSTSGFALPTVLIASIVMLIVLLTGLSAVSSANTALRQQYYDRVTKEAVESGVTKTDACLAKSNQIVTWSDANPLMPNTDCNGVVITAAPAPSQYILDTPNLKTTFSVPAPIDQNGTMRVNVTATLYKYRTSGSGTPQTQTETRSSLVGGQNSFSNVAFGYYSGDGAQFAVVLPTGDVKAVGTNTNGRLGNGTTASTLTPTNFILPGSEKGVSAYTNFLSVGRNMFVLTQSGKVYGAGSNDTGELGNAFNAGTNNAVSTPVQFGTLGNTGQPKAKFVSLLLNSTFVLADDNNIYAVGPKNSGEVGYACGSNYCSTPQRVGLPAVNLSDPNTLPVVDPGWVQPTNIAADRLTMYVRMQGGAVYGWGYNDTGQLGNGTTNSTSTPVRMGSFGNAGQPKAVQIGQDGVAVYILDDQGDVWTTGWNGYGGFGGARSIMHLGSGYCMDVPNANYVNGQRIGIWACNRLDQQYYQWYPDGTIRVGGKCVDNAGNSSVNGNSIQLWDCNGLPQQQWGWSNNGSIVSTSVGKCIDNSGNNNTNGNLLVLYDCNAGAAQIWSMTGGSLTLNKIPKPTGVNKYVKFTTDQYSVTLLDDSGRAWSAGLNDFGQLGVGTAALRMPRLLQVAGIPAGRTVTDIYTTKYGGESAGSANTYFILDDGSVYGTGSNDYGQLGNGAALGSPPSYSPVKMNLPAGVLARTVQSGFSTTVVITTSGKIYTVGNNSNGQLGDGTTTSSSTPKANQYTNQRTTIRY